MYLFTLINLLLAIAVQYQLPQLEWLTDDYVLLGLSLLGMLSLLSGFFYKLSTPRWHDGTATAILLLWFGLWWPQFTSEAPMFFYYPLYFALLTAILNLSLVQRAAEFDVESVLHLRYLESMTRFNMRFVIALVIGSLFVPQHYTLFPVVMTFFIIRHTMLICIEAVDRYEAPH